MLFIRPKSWLNPYEIQYSEQYFSQIEFWILKMQTITFNMCKTENALQSMFHKKYSLIGTEFVLNSNPYSNVDKNVLQC